MSDLKAFESALESKLAEQKVVAAEFKTIGETVDSLKGKFKSLFMAAPGKGTGGGGTEGTGELVFGDGGAPTGGGTGGGVKSALATPIDTVNLLPTLDLLPDKLESISAANERLKQTNEDVANSSKMEKLLSSCTLERINTKEYIFKKILMGDKKDDVPGVFPHQTKSGKNSNIAAGKSNKIWELYQESEWKDYSMEYLWDNEDFLGWIAGLSLRLISQTDNSENRDKFKKFYEENARLVWLNSRTLPKNMVEGLKNHVQELDSKEKITLNIDKKEMIENSPWASEAKPPKGFDPFELFN